MKKIFTFAVSALMASASWAGVITLDMNAPINPSTIEYGDNGVWTECYNDVDYTWLEFGANGGTFMLSHLIDGEGASWGGMYWDGFTPAIGGDVTDYGQAGSSAGWTTMYGGCMAGGGCVINADGTVSADAAQPYLVAYYSNWAVEGPSNQVMFVDKDGNTTFEPVGVYVSNHPWPYYGCVHGDGFGTGFEEGDYFELIAHGVDAEGNETTVSMNLVDVTNGELHAVNDWTFFDLSSLGKVESVYFTLNSTDVGPYGMNTAAYFCMDKFQVKAADDQPTAKTDAPSSQKTNYVFKDGTTYYNAYTVTMIQTEPSTIYYRVGVMNEDGNVVYGDWMEYVDELNFNQEGTFMIEAYAVAQGKAESDHIFDGFTVSKMTDIDELAGSKAVASVRYFNLAGQEMQQPAGLSIQVTTFVDGTTSAVKVIK
jgi:hypothetical protein